MPCWSRRLGLVPPLDQLYCVGCVPSSDTAAAEVTPARFPMQLVLVWLCGVVVSGLGGSLVGRCPCGCSMGCTRHGLLEVGCRGGLTVFLSIVRLLGVCVPFVVTRLKEARGYPRRP